MITLYGITASRAFRPRWLLEELGLEYRQVALDYRGDELKDPAYRAINPNGRIPALQDGELVLWESMAINLYLASRYGRDKGLWPDSAQTEGLAYQWSFWVMTEVEESLLVVLMHKRVLPLADRDPGQAAVHSGRLQRPCSVLNAALAEREYLVDNRFTVADLNLAAVLSWMIPARFGLQPYPDLAAWLKRCLDRPARKVAQK